MVLDYRRLDGLAPLAVAVWVFFASFLSPLRSQITRPDDQTPLIDACLCSGDRANALKLVVVVITALLCAVGAALARRTRWLLWTAAAFGWLAFSMWAAPFVASYYAGSRLRANQATAYLVTATTILAGPALLPAARHDQPLQTTLGYMASILLLMLAAPFIYGLWVRIRRSEQAATTQTREQEARQLERVRIAREMHDVVAHRVALIVLHAGALELAAKDERTRQTAGLIRTAGREALIELRHVLNAMREPAPAVPQPTFKDIERLVEDTRDAGVPVQMYVDGEVDDLPSTVERTAYRLIQEGLTNIVKHAGLPDTTVRLSRQDHSLVVSVANGPPRRTAEHMPGSGHGLIGLRERVELLRGSFEATPQPGGGFLIRAQIPVRQNEVVT